MEATKGNVSLIGEKALDSGSETQSPGSLPLSGQASSSGSLSERASQLSEKERSPDTGTSENGHQDLLPAMESQETPFPSSQTAGEQTSSDAFIPFPFFAGEKHGIDWSRSPLKNGEKPSPFATSTGQLDLGLRAEDLSLPSTMAFMDPSQRPQNEKEWREILEGVFCDIAHEYKPQEWSNSIELFITARQNIEKAYFIGKDVKLYVKQAPRIEDPNGRANRFQFRFANDTYGLATYVVETEKTNELFSLVRETDRVRDHMMIKRELLDRIDSAITLMECDNLEEGLRKLKERYEANEQKEYAEHVGAWAEKLVKKRKEIEDGLKKDKEEEDEEKDGEDEEEKKNDEGEGEEEKMRPRPEILIGITPIKPPKDGVYQLRNRHPPPIFPDFEPPLEHAEGTNKPIYPFDWIVSKRIKGWLYTMNNSAAAATSARWRESGVQVTIPCAMDGTEKEVLVVDHTQARIIAMPSAKPTGEVYHLVPPKIKGNDATTKTKDMVKFKQTFCSLSEQHIMIGGFFPKRKLHSLVIIDRVTREAAVYDFNIQVSCAIISPSIPDTLLIGTVEGSIIRMPIRLRDEIRWHIPSQGGVPKKTLILKNPEDKTLQEIDVIPADQDPVMRLTTGEFVPVSAIRERGKKILANSRTGLHLFRLFEKQNSERHVHIDLRETASYDWRGNLLVLHKNNNSIQLVQMHDCELEVSVNPPSELQPSPPPFAVQMSSVCIHDNAVTLFHMDGSQRVVELEVAREIVMTEKSASAKEKTEEEKKASFLPETSKKKTTTAKKPQKGKGKKIKK